MCLPMRVTVASRSVATSQADTVCGAWIRCMYREHQQDALSAHSAFHIRHHASLVHVRGTGTRHASVLAVLE